MDQNPFLFRVDTVPGPLLVSVLQGRVASVSTPTGIPGPGDGPSGLLVDGRRFGFLARIARGDSGWAFRDARALSPSSSLPGDADLVALSVLPCLSSALEANLRRFVERDIVALYAARREDEAAMEQVRNEIARREDKLRSLDAARATREPGRSRKEARLRKELERLPSIEPCAPARGAFRSPKS